MCGFKTKKGIEGIVFSNGEFIPITELKIENLSEWQLREIENMHIQNEINIKKQLYSNASLFEKALKKLDQIEKKMLTKEMVKDAYMEHLKSKETRDFLERTWMEILKEKLLTAGNIAKAITAILILLGMLMAIKEILK